MVAAQTRIAYAQVDSFIEMLDDMYINMIPRKLRYFFKQEKDINYNKPVVPDIPIKNQNLTREALALIAFLNLNYWCKDKDEKLSVTGDSLEFETWYSKNKNEIMIHPDMKEWFDRIIEDVITDIKENKDTIFTESMSFNRQDRRHEDSQSYLIQTDKGFVHFLPNQTYQIVDDPTQASIGYNKDEMRMMLIGLLRKYSNITAAKLTNLKDVKKDKKEEMNGYEQEVQEDNEELELINNVEKIKEIREAKTAGIPNKYQDRVRAFYKGADGYWVIDLKQGWYTEYGTNYIRNKSKRDCLYELSTNTFNKTEESMKEDGIEIDGIKGTITNSGMAK